MIDLYTAPTPNGWKASIMLEELELPYTVHPIDLGKLVQKEDWYRAINPNGRIPAVGERPAVQRGRAVPAPPEPDETPKPEEIEKAGRTMLA